jgi:hypothetical protein
MTLGHEELARFIADLLQQRMIRLHVCRLYHDAACALHSTAVEVSRCLKNGLLVMVFVLQ